MNIYNYHSCRGERLPSSATTNVHAIAAPPPPTTTYKIMLITDTQTQNAVLFSRRHNTSHNEVTLHSTLYILLCSTHCILFYTLCENEYDSNVRKIIYYYICIKLADKLQSYYCCRSRLIVHLCFDHALLLLLGELQRICCDRGTCAFCAYDPLSVCYRYMYIIVNVYLYDNFSTLPGPSIIIISSVVSCRQPTNQQNTTCAVDRTNCGRRDPQTIRSTEPHDHDHERVYMLLAYLYGLLAYAIRERRVCNIRIHTCAYVCISLSSRVSRVSRGGPPPLNVTPDDGKVQRERTYVLVCVCVVCFVEHGFVCAHV